MLSMADDRAFLAKTFCAAGPIFSSFLFWPFRAPALRAHVSSSAISLSPMHAVSVGPTCSGSACVGPGLLNTTQSFAVLPRHAEYRYTESGRGMARNAAPVSASVMVLFITTCPLNFILNFPALGTPAACSGLMPAWLTVLVRAGPGPTPSVRVGLAVASIIGYLHKKRGDLRSMLRRKATKRYGRLL